MLQEQNHWRETVEETLRSANTSTKQQWIAAQARKHPDRVFPSVHHRIDGDWMREAWRRTRKDGAAGIDGVTATDYEKNLEANLEDLRDRILSCRYFAPPVRRTWIPKGNGEVRPLGIPTLEDKVAQRAILMLLEPIYEADFVPGSYGFRPGRSAQEALHAIDQGIMKKKKRWVIDADVSKYFDSIPHRELRAFLDLRIKDGVLRRMINKWLRAGVLEEGVRHTSEAGTPQGGVLSPLLSNLFLHYVLDRWVEQTVQPRLRGRCQLVRYADDFVLLFEHQRDCERVLAVLGQRLARFGLRLHAEKTRSVDFRAKLPPDPGAGATFDFLGFTHVWVRSRWKYAVLRQLTAKGRLARSVRAVREWCRRHRHAPLLYQHNYLARVIRGHCAYYGRSGNRARTASFRYQVIRIWRKWLSRRSRSARVNWDQMTALLRRLPLPTAKIMHGYGTA